MIGGEAAAAPWCVSSETVCGPLCPDGAHRMLGRTLLSRLLRTHATDKHDIFCDGGAAVYSIVILEFQAFSKGNFISYKDFHVYLYGMNLCGFYQQVFKFGYINILLKCDISNDHFFALEGKKLEL